MRCTDAQCSRTGAASGPKSSNTLNVLLAIPPGHHRPRRCTHRHARGEVSTPVPLVPTSLHCAGIADECVAIEEFIALGSSAATRTTRRCIAAAFTDDFMDLTGWSNAGLANQLGAALPVRGVRHGSRRHRLPGQRRLRRRLWQQLGQPRQHCAPPVRGPLQGHRPQARVQHCSGSPSMEHAQQDIRHRWLGTEYAQRQQL